MPARFVWAFFRGATSSRRRANLIAKHKPLNAGRGDVFEGA